MRYCIGHDRGGGVGPHAAGVWTRVAVTHTFMVLRRADGQNGCAVAKNEEGCFFAVHEFFDHDFRAVVTVEHVGDSGFRFGQGHRNGDAFASSQAISFNNDGRALVAHVGQCRVAVGEMRVASGWGVGRVADFFGKGLGCFKLRGLLRWAEDQQTRVP